ncbi:MAG: transposase [Thermoanaerobaculia bacterium]
MRPGRELNEVIIGALGRAQRLHGMAVHGCVFLSNHYHLLLSPESPQQLARFMNHLNSRLAREVCRLRRWSDHVWDRRYQSIEVSTEEAAQVARLRYMLSHGCKEHLVEEPEQWPGVHCSGALLKGERLLGCWIDRTAQYRAKRAAREAGGSEFSCREELVFSPLPC